MPSSRQVRVTRCREISGLLEQVSLDRVEPVVFGDAVVTPKSGDELEARPRASGHGHRDGMVQGHDRVVRDSHQELVQSLDLGPVGLLGARRFVMEGGDGRLELVGPGTSAGQGGRDEGDALGDGVSIPKGAVLVGHRDQ